MMWLPLLVIGLPGVLAVTMRRRYRMSADASRLQQLGWREIEVVDDDLGRSAAGLASRARFARMAADGLLGPGTVR